MIYRILYVPSFEQGTVLTASGRRRRSRKAVRMIPVWRLA